MTRAILAAALAFSAACSSDSDSERLEGMIESDVSQLITAEKALSVARAAVPGGVAVELELELDDDGDEPATWEALMYVADKRQLVEVEIDAMTASVLEIEVEAEEDDEEDDDDD